MKTRSKIFNNLMWPASYVALGLFIISDLLIVASPVIWIYFGWWLAFKHLIGGVALLLFTSLLYLGIKEMVNGALDKFDWNKVKEE